MAADLREMQENQGLSEKQIDKLRFVCLILYCNPSFLSMYMTYKKANGEAHKRLSVWPSLVHVWNTAFWQFRWKLGLTIWGSKPP